MALLSLSDESLVWTRTTYVTPSDQTSECETRVDDGLSAWSYSGQWTGRTVFQLKGGELMAPLYDYAGVRAQRKGDVCVAGLWTPCFTTSDPMLAAEVTQRVRCASVPEYPALPPPHRQPALLKDMRDRIDALETAFLNSDLQQASQQAARLTLGARSIAAQLGLRDVYPDLLSEVHWSNMTAVFEDQDEAVAATSVMSQKESSSYAH